jgi:hypothetical protein
MKELKSLLDLMFEPSDTICIQKDKYAYHSLTIPTVLSGEVTLVSPNQKVPIFKAKTEELILLAINPIRGYRNDKNVYRHQTFLWEIDVGTLASQMPYMKSLGLPYSAAIYSGNKSIHFATVLDEPIDEDTYKTLFKWACAIGTLFDDQCVNPSRCIRIPGVIRPDTGKEQKLIELKEKIKLDDFIAWLNQYEHLKPKPREERKPLTNELDYGNLSKWARNQFENGIDFTGGRNKTWFSLACDLTLSGFSEEDAINILSQYFVEESDFKEKEFLMAIASAYKYIYSRN